VYTDADGLSRDGIDVAEVLRQLHLPGSAAHGIMDAASLGRVAAAAFVGVRADSNEFTRGIEAELKRIILSVLALPQGAACFLTGSGTESILLGLFAARCFAPKRNVRPRVIGPRSLHHSVRKCVALLDIELITTDVDAEQRADPQALGRAIDRRTIAIVASAPSWASGVWDPIDQIAAVAAEHELYFHVDACIGGFLLPFLGDSNRGASLSMSGTSSVAVDLHKFGYAPLSLSALCFPHDVRADSTELAAFAACPTAASGLSLASDRPFWPIAAAWAIARSLGRSGYARLARQMIARRARMSEASADRGLSAGGEENSPVLRLSSTPDAPLSLLGERLTRAGIPHVLCPTENHARLRVDPSLGDDEFEGLIQKLTSL